MRILLIWQEIPETTKFFVINDPSEHELSILTAAHGALINATDNTDEQEYAVSFLNIALSDPKYVTEPKTVYAKRFEFKGDIDFWLSRWFKNEVAEVIVPTSGPFDQVFVSGVLL
jgi:hypothetical protein